jgi:hypothetical protein
MDLQGEIDELRRALAEVNRALRPLRERPASGRLVRRLEADLRRMQEDVDDLSLDAQPAAGGLLPPLRDFEPIPMPPREDFVTYDPEAEDEGLAGWRSPAAPSQDRVVHPR